MGFEGSLYVQECLILIIHSLVSLVHISRADPNIADKQASSQPLEACGRSLTTYYVYDTVLDLIDNYMILQCEEQIRCFHAKDHLKQTDLEFPHTIERTNNSIIN